MSFNLYREFHGADMPFTVEQFLTVFSEYNQAIWPAQILAYILGCLAVVLCWKGIGLSSRFVAAILGLMWVWNGVAYHMVFFSKINPAAYAFGVLFLLGGIMFFRSGVLRPVLTFRFRSDVYGITGLVFVIYAMFLYPLLGMMLGHGYPRSPVFGVAPCPTTIFTFGVLLWSSSGMPIKVVIAPLLWTTVGTAAAVNLGMKEDLGLLVAGLVSMVMIVLRKREKSEVSLRGREHDRQF
jgi:hypothetical protein